MNLTSVVEERKSCRSSVDAPTGKFHQSLRNAPCTEKFFLQGAAALPEGHLFLSEDVPGHIRHARQRTYSLDIHTDVAMVKGNAEQIAGVADIERLFRTNRLA